MKTTLDHASRAPDAGDSSSGDFDDVLRALSRAPAVRLADIDLVGRTVGRFLVKRRLGEGGMGVVYEGFDPVLGRAVALKVLRAAHRGSAARARLHEEARRVAALHHPHLATVYDVGEHDGIVFLALERAAGRSLRARLSAPPPLALPRAIAILRAIAGGLGCAHEAGIVHRDLKPENVVVGDDGTVKIIDFGIAAASGQSGVSAPNARPAGTRRYMAPEHAAGAPASARADVFAFGVLGREVLTATMVPGRERSTRAALQRFLARCTAQAPEDRPADGNALLAELDAIASPRRGATATTVAAALGAAAVAAVVSIAAGRSAPAPADAQPSAALTPARASRPRPHAQRTAVAPPRSPAAPATPAAVAERDSFDDEEPAGDLPEGPSRDAAPSARSPGPLQEEGRVVLAAMRSPARSPASRATRDVLDPDTALIPVTAYMDERGQLVATVRLDGYGGGTRPSVRPAVTANKVPTLEPLAELDPNNAEAEVVPDGNGGTVLHLKVRIRPQGGAPDSGNSPGKQPGTLAPKMVKTPGLPVGRILDLLTVPNDSSHDIDTGVGKPDSKNAHKSNDIVLPLCAEGMLFDIRAELLEDGWLELTAEGEDGDRKLLAALNEHGELMTLGDGICACEVGAPGMDG